MNINKFFLLFVALGLLPVALSYGITPQHSLPFLLDVTVTSVDSQHIFRAICGLYLAMIVCWLVGAGVSTFTQTALTTVAIFMLGLGAGRAVSLVIDGMPSVLLLIYLVLELVMGFAACFLLYRSKSESSVQ